MAKKFLVLYSQVVSGWTPAFCAACRRRNFISESVKSLQITIDSPCLHHALFALAEVAEICRANSLHLNEILILSFSQINAQMFLEVKFA